MFALEAGKILFYLLLAVVGTMLLAIVLTNLPQKSQSKPLHYQRATAETRLV